VRRINRSTYRVKPFYLSSETVLPIKWNRSTYRVVKPFYLSNRSTDQTQLVPLHLVCAGVRLPVVGSAC
jgi:hypothetical protein